MTTKEEDDDVLLREDEAEDDGAPKDLPEAQETPQDYEGQLIPDAGRICPKCHSGDNVRFTSSIDGRQAYCGPCKFDWPLGPPVATIAMPIMGRNATGKQTLQQPDWNLAFEDIDPSGPK